MELRSARAGERDQVLDLLANWYGDRDFFARYKHHDPGCRDDLCLVACESGRIIATAQIFERAVNLAGANVPMGGVGSVYTMEGRRGEGLASALLELALQIMERQEFEISLLFAERLDFYTRFGWRPVTRQFTAVADAHKIRAPADFRLSYFSEAPDLEEVAALHRGYSGRFNGSAVRDDTGWRANLKIAGEPEEYFVVCRDNAGSLAAYARATLFHGFPMVTEYGYAPHRPQAMLTLMQHFGQVASGLEPSIVPAGGAMHSTALRKFGDPPVPALLVTHSAHDPALEDLMRDAGAFLMHHPDNFFMWRAIAPHKLARRFGAAAERAESALFAALEAPDTLYWTADRF
jgi:predicted N-acetyltransferase YhbS